MSSQVIELSHFDEVSGAGVSHLTGGHTPSTRLVSHTIPWPAISLLDFLALATDVPRVYWERAFSPVACAGFGAAAVLTATGTTRFETIRQAAVSLFETAVIDLGMAPAAVGPRLFGGFSFDPDHTPTEMWQAFPPAFFFLPRYLLTHYEGQAWLTINQLVPGHPSSHQPGYTNGHTELAGTTWDASVEEVDRLYLATLACIANPMHEEARLQYHFDIDCQMDRLAWYRQVRRVVRQIRRGELAKVVLARTCDVQADQPIRYSQVLTRLREQYPDCYRFLLEPAMGNAFFGATPELLVEVNGPALRTVALAGSIQRGNTPEEDAALGQTLLASAKDRQEHAFVVEAIQTALRDLVQQLHVPATPELRRLHNIQHLQTPIEGILRPDRDIFSAIEALHPTPAMGGVPREIALRVIAAQEPQSRGWYAAPVGWIDACGNGEFSVAIRSAVGVGRQARLYAGAGIVADSDPVREWEETGLKFRPMLEALGALDQAAELAPSLHPDER